VVRLLRKYKKWIFWGLVILVVPTFVVWGGYRKSARMGRRGRAEVTGEAAVARVGTGAVTAEQFRRSLNAEADRRAKYAARPTFKELSEDGTASRVMDRLVDAAILDDLQSKRKFQCRRDFLVEQLKKDPSFQREDGQFNADTWNAFVDSGEDRNWNAIYSSVSSQLNRQLLLQSLQASGRVLDADIHQEFDANYSRIKVKYAAIEPKTEPSQDEIQAQYDADPAVYQIPEQRIAQFVSISLRPPRPALVDELVERARGGEDFGELAKQYSKWFDAEKGGDMGWVGERPGMPDYLRPILELPVEAVSDPTEGSGSYFIYKVEDERTNPTTNLREVKGRQICIRPELTEAERAERENQAKDILAKAKESGDLAAAASASGLDVKTTDVFSVETTELNGVPRADVRGFARGFENVAADQFAEVITARENLYVAKVTQVNPPVPQPLDAVRDRVEKDTIQKIKTSDEYAKKIEDLCQEIAAKAKTLQDIETLHPELGVTINETKEFMAKEAPVVPGLMVRANEIYATFRGKEPGAFAGPVKGMGPVQYFLELVSLNPPDETVWTPEKRAEEEKKLRETSLQMAQYGRVMDYLQYIKDRTPPDYNNEAYAGIIGSDTPTDEEKGLPTGVPAVPRGVAFGGDSGL